MVKLLLASPDACYGGYSVVSESIRWYKLVLRSFFLLDSLFQVLGSMSIVGNCLILLYELYCYKLLRPCILCHHCHRF